jgi:HK97 family phage major capsid protein
VGREGLVTFMALLLADAGRLTNNQFVAGLIETIITESQVLQLLPFLEVNGASLVYNQEASTGSAAWYAVADTWTEQAVTVTQKTASLKILGGDVDVDNFLEQTYRLPNDMRAIAVAEKAKAVAYSFNDAFFNGTGASNQPTGIFGLVTGGQTLDLGTNGATPTLANYDNLIDLVKPGKPDVIFMSKRSRRTLTALARASSSSGQIEYDWNKFGQKVLYYDGIPVIVDDNISDAMTKGSSSVASKVAAVKFGFNEGVMGLMNGMIQAVDVGNLETKDAWRTRLKWYTGLCNFRDLSLAVMTGVLV